MNRRWYLKLLPVLCALVLAGCGSEGRYGLALFTSGHHQVSDGEVIHGALVVTGGRVAVPRSARVIGSLYVLGGSVVFDGTVEEDTFLLDGSLRLGEQAQVAGDLLLSGGALDRSPEASIDGRVETMTGLTLPEDANSRGWLSIDRLIWMLVQALGLAALAGLVAWRRPHPLGRVADALGQHPITAAAMGILSGIVGICALVLMAFTIVLIPVTTLGLLFGVALVVYGWIAAGALLGEWLRRSRGWPLTSGQAATLGTLLVMLGLNLSGAVPLIGGLIAIGLTSAGLGAVVLTRLGRQPFIPHGHASTESDRERAAWEKHVT